MLAPCPGCRLAGCAALFFLLYHFKYVSCELDQLSGRYRVSTVERSRFNVAICVIHESRGQQIHRSTHAGGKRGERSGYIWLDC